MRRAVPATICWLSVLLTTTLASRPTVADHPFVRGDVGLTADGSLDIGDAVRTLIYLFQGVPLVTCDDAADTDDDGAITISDPIMTLSFIFLGGSPPAPPFPNCGGDPTDDLLSCGDFSTCPSCAEDCVEPYSCIRIEPDEFACTDELETCEAVRSVYDSLTIGVGGSCPTGLGCHLVLGHCGIGLGGCYHAVGPSVRQEDLDALASRFLDLGCTGPVCGCLPPPEKVECVEGRCSL